MLLLLLLLLCRAAPLHALPSAALAGKAAAVGEVAVGDPPAGVTAKLPALLVPADPLSRSASLIRCCSVDCWLLRLHDVMAEQEAGHEF